MNVIKKIIAKFVDLAFYMFLGVVVLFLMQLFCFTSFRIPSDSMEPALKDGDRILVNKMIKGARLFDVFAALDNEDVTIHRMPGWGSFQRNDILVFNFPY
ncbi:signal peptidase I, partial [uncultured Bacteroides sp.]